MSNQYCAYIYMADRAAITFFCATQRAALSFADDYGRMARVVHVVPHPRDLTAAGHAYHRNERGDWERSLLTPAQMDREGY